MMMQASYWRLMGVMLCLCASWSWAQDSTVLVEGGARDTYQARGGYGVEYGTFEGRKSARMWWNAGSGTLNEIAFRGRPNVLAFEAGVKLAIDVNSDDFPKLSGAGVRVIDAMGEIHQFGKIKIPQGQGWKVWEVDLSPDRITDRWGGGNEGKEKIDPPVKLLSLLFNAPEKPTEKRSILVGEIRRNKVDSAAIEPQTKLSGIKLTLLTGQPMPVVFKGQEEALKIQLESTEESDGLNVMVECIMTDYEGVKRQWTSPTVQLKGGTKQVIPAGPMLEETGWFVMEPVIKLADDSAALKRPSRQLAYIDPVGVRPLPPDDDFYFGIDTRVRNPQIFKLLSMIGVDMVRFGAWNGINTGPGQWRWPQFDESVKTIRELGMQVLFSFTFTPDYAVHPDYEKRFANKEKIGGKPMKLGSVMPDTAKLRQAIGEFLKRNEHYGLKIYDLWNEPDLAGFWQGTTEEYLEFMRVCYEAIKAVQPDAVVLTGGIATLSSHGGHHLNPDMTRRMIVDNQDHYDAISVHQHGDFAGFVQGIDGPLAEYRGQLRKDKPLWFTETGFNGDPREMAQTLVKKFALAQARGGKGFIWYALYPGGAGGGYSMANKNFEPQPIIPAYNEMTRLMRGKRYQQQWDIGQGHWLLTYAGGNQTLLIGWEEDAEITGKVEYVRIPAGATARLMNVMGRPLPVETHGDLVLFPLGRELRYLLIQGTESVERVTAPVLLTGNPRGMVGQVVPVTATLRNPLQKPAIMELTWTLPDGSQKQQKLTLESGQTEQSIVEVAIPAVAAGGAKSQVTLAYQLQGTPLSGAQSLQVESVLLIPSAGMSDREADFKMMTRKNIVNPNDADPTRAHLNWKGESDLSAQCWLSLQGDALVMRLVVTDDKHNQPHPIEDAWQADSIQIAFTVPGRSGSWVLMMARSNQGADMFQVSQAPVGLTRAFEGKVAFESKPQAGGGKMVYELRLPLEGLGMDAGQLRTDGLRFNLIINDADDAGREGFAFVAPGMGFGKYESDRWPGMIFE